MNPVQKLLLAIALVLLGAAGVFFVLQNNSTEPEITHPERQPDRTTSREEPIQPVTSETRNALSRPEAGERIAAPGQPSGAELKQGVRGRVTDPAGAPLAGAKVFLMPGFGSEGLFTMLQAVQKGVVFPPVARGETDANGIFALGLERADPAKVFEVRILSERYVDAKVPNLRLKESDWYDAGTIQMKKGIVVHGTVTVAGSGGIPVANAEVSVRLTGGGMPDASPTPGRERGVTTQTDANGLYRLENVEAGLVTMSAVAPKYARLERPGTTLDPAGDNQVHFELQQGLSIGGVVVDALGNPISNAKINAIAISSKTPVNEETRSDPDGRFEVIGLIEGPYQVTTVCPGYMRNEQKPVQGGIADLQVVLEKQGIVKVQVFGKNGRLLSNYVLTVKTVFEGSDSYGNADIPAKHVRNPKDGIAIVEGIEASTNKYALQVEADGYAKGFSEPFAIVVGGEPPLLQVQMNEGGVIEGQILGHDGQPLSGCAVVTLPNHLDENPFTAMFGAMIPYNITRTQVATNAEGRFRIAMLNAGKYQLKFVHPEHFEVFLKDNEVQTGKTTTVPVLRLDRGTSVGGTVRVDGAAAGQVKVTLGSIPDPQKPGPGFHVETISDNEGRFVFPKRIPPGRYEVRAARQTLPNPLMQFGDFQKTKQEVEFGRGQAEFRLDINITN